MTYSSTSSPLHPSEAKGQTSPRENAEHFSEISSLLLTPATAPDDQLVGFLVLAAGRLAERRHAPRRDRVAPALGLALAASVRVVDRVHGRTAHGRPLAAPAASPGLAARNVLVVDVSDLSHRRPACERNATDLA